MKVRFENCEVDVWKLRKGVVLGLGSHFVHLNGIDVTTNGVKIYIKFYDDSPLWYYSHMLEWLEGH